MWMRKLTLKTTQRAGRGGGKELWLPCNHMCCLPSKGSSWVPSTQTRLLITACNFQLQEDVHHVWPLYALSHTQHNLINKNKSQKNKRPSKQGHGNMRVNISWKNKQLGMVAHAFNRSTWEAEAGRFLSSRPAWSTEWVPGQPELHRETLSWKTKKFFKFKKKQKIKNNKMIWKERNDFKSL